jgi:DNA-directed RNA polymerase III subunit RPC4
MMAEAGDEQTAEALPEPGEGSYTAAEPSGYEAGDSVPVTTAQSAAPTPAATSTAAAPATRGASRFKPKAVRRGEREREELALEELRKQNSKAAEEARARRGSLRGRPRGRGRGGSVVTRTAQPSGPFSQLPGSGETLRYTSGSPELGFLHMLT